MRIGKAAEVSGASVRALRHYEDEGLITPGRLSNGYRDYCPSTITAILRIRSLLDAGLPVRLIRDVLPDLGNENGLAAIPRNDFLAEVEKYRDRLDRRIAVLNARRSAVDAYLRHAHNARSQR